MPNTKKIQVPYSETGKTVYAIIQRQVDNYYLNDADGAFAAAPADYFVALTEDTYVKGLYVLNESRTAWNDGTYTITVYKQLAGSPAPTTDFLIGSGEMDILLDLEAGTSAAIQASTDALDIVERAEILCNDLLDVRWPRSEWLKWLNDGQLEIAKLQAKASTKRYVMQLVSGSKQTLPSDTIRLLPGMRNMGASGSTPGSAITVMQREIIDAAVPGWHVITSGVPVFFIPDPFDTMVFFTYPPSNGQYAEIVYQARPAAVADFSAGTKITIKDEYSTNLLDYMLWRAALKDDENGNGTRAVTFKQAFLTNLGVAQ